MTAEPLLQKQPRHAPGRPFPKGTSGNPAGKRPGTRCRATLAAEQLLDGEAEALTRRAIGAAIGGDNGALRICMDRILPPRRDRPVNFTFPPIANAVEAATAMGAVLAAVAAGEVTPLEANELAKLVDVFASTLETAALAERLERLEAMMAGNQ